MKFEPASHRRVIFVNRFFYPNQSATAQIVSDLAFQLAEAGKTVHIIASGAGNPPSERSQVINSVIVHRTNAVDLSSWGLFGRAIEYCFFYVAAARLLQKIARRGDVVIAKTDPPLISVVAAFLGNRRGALLINWLQDLYPEVARGLH